MTYETLGYHETDIRVRFGMVDRYGTLWHGHVLAFCEAARADLARTFELSALDLLKEDIAVPMLELNCRFKTPAFDEDALVVQSTLLKPDLALPELVFNYRIVRAAPRGEIVRVMTRQMMIRASGRVTTRVPDSIRGRLQRVWDYLATRPVWRD